MSRLERIVAACGGILLDGGNRALIRGPDHSNKDRSVSLVETEDGRVLIHCFSPRDNWRDVRRMLIAHGLLDLEHGEASGDRSPARQHGLIIQPDSEERIARAKKFWEEAGPITGTVAERYLLGRAIVGAFAQSAALRFHPRMTSVDDRERRPALLAAIVNSDGALQGVQATLLSQYGAAKAPVATPRRVIGKLMGGAVRLQDAGETMAIGEGVETMLSASAMLRVPAWAALTADNLSFFQPPAELRRLIVAFDNDAAGRAACIKLQARLGAIELASPPEGADDWNSAARELADRT